MSGFPSVVGRLLPALLACAAAAGCGGDGTYRVSGKVTFKGQPVPAGKIYFMPDGSKGNTGPTGYADIKDGQYDTSATGGRGAGKGPMIVAIEGFDPSTPGKAEKGDTSGEATVKTLFPRYETTTDLPGEAATKDFDVPADAGSGKPQKGVGPIIP
jgi:hypothetical protein